MFELLRRWQRRYTASMDDEYMSVSEAATYLGVNVQTVYTLLRTGTLPFEQHETSRVKRIPVAAIEAYAANRLVWQQQRANPKTNAEHQAEWRKRHKK